MNSKVHLLKTTVVALSLATLVPAARATVLTYVAVLDGPSEFPANPSPGIGSATVTYDSVAHTLRVQATFSGLAGNTVSCHIHAPTMAPGSGNATVATTMPTFSGFPLGVTSGSYSNTLDLTLSSSYNPAYIVPNGGTTAGAEVALTAAMAAGKSYFNIHSSAYPGGEIRGFLVTAPTLYTLTVTTNGGGAITPGSGTYGSNTTVVLTATPHPSYLFSGWSGSITGTNNPISVTMTNNKAITGNFVFVANGATVSIGLAAQIAWFAVTNVNYQVQAASVLASNSWFDLGGTTRGNNATNFYYDPFGTNRNRSYRVVTRP